MTDDGQGVRFHVHGMKGLCNFRLEDPPTIQWAVITPDGGVEIHESESGTAYSPWDGHRFQWRVIHDVNQRIDPKRRRTPRQVTRMINLIDAYDRSGNKLGFYYVEPFVPHDMRTAFNNLATLLIAVARDVQVPKPIYGTVLVFGDPPQGSDNPDAENLITSLTEDQVAALHVLVGSARTAIAQGDA